MAKEFEDKSNNEKNTSHDMKLSNEAIKKLMNRKPSITIKDGVAQVDKSHPDYKFWMEN